MMTQQHYVMKESLLPRNHLLCVCILGLREGEKKKEVQEKGTEWNFLQGRGVLMQKQTMWPGSVMRGISRGRKIEQGVYSEQFLREVGILGW